MSLTFTVEYLEGPGQGMVHLRGAPPGPAGEARLRLADGMACWFDPTRPPAITDCWFDLDTIDDNNLTRAFGPGTTALRGAGGIDRLRTDGREDGWIGVASRLATLDRTRATPLGTEHPALWAIEAIVLLDALDSAGLAPDQWLEPELDRALPGLERLHPGSLDPVSVPAVALGIALDRLDPFHPALDRLDDLAARLDRTAGAALQQLLDGLQAQPVEPAGSWLSAPTHAAAYDQLWSQLPSSFFPAGLFAEMVLGERTTVGLQPRLRISMERPTGIEQALFIRLVDVAGANPAVIGVDALLVDDGRYVTEMDVLPGFDFDRTRIEIVTDLNQPLLSRSAHATTRGVQWALLALKADRTGDRATARRYWRLSQNLHLAAGETELADAAEQSARQDPDSARSRPFLAESHEGRAIFDPEEPDQ